MLDRGQIRRLSEREAAALDERTPASAEMFNRARGVLAGGVASSLQTRAPWPIYLSHGEGQRVWDVDGNELLDFHNGFSSMIQGHAHPAIGAAIARRYARGTHFAAPTEDAVAVAEELSRRWGLPLWRFTNSGTESTMGAIRIARGHTGRSAVIRILGSYHGHHDAVVSGAGVPPSVAAEVQAVQFNDAAAMEQRIAELEPACVIMEAAMTSIGVVLPEPGYLEAVRELTSNARVPLIFDEVKTGLSIAEGGATERFGVRPDMVTLAKTLGAGLPTGAIGMTEELARVIEDGRVHHFGTFNGNPLGMAAARANLTELLTADAYRRLFALNDTLVAGCDAVIAEHGLPARTVSLGSKGCVTWGKRVIDHESFERRKDAELSELLWLWFMNREVFTTHGREQEWNLSVAHDEDAVERYVEVFAELAEQLSRRLSGSARA